MRSLVTNPDWSEARKSTTLAMSSGLPIRLIGWRGFGGQAGGGVKPGPAKHVPGPRAR
jgi:hypothetical protein